MKLLTISSARTQKCPDIIIWDLEKKICTIVEVSCPADVSISRKIDEKLNNYAPLVRNMQIMYSNYKFVVVPIIIGGLGYVPKCLLKYLSQPGFDNMEIKGLIRKLQNISICDTVKICKTFLKFEDRWKNIVILIELFGEFQNSVFRIISWPDASHFESP